MGMVSLKDGADIFPVLCPGDRLRGSKPVYTYFILVGHKQDELLDFG